MAILYEGGNPFDEDRFDEETFMEGVERIPGFLQDALADAECLSKALKAALKQLKLKEKA